MTHRQAVAEELRISEVLSPFKPVVVGTVPLGIDVPTSDVDIVCEATELERFAALVQTTFGDRPGFELRRQPLSGHQAVIVSFITDGVRVEIVAQAIPISEQPAYRHTIVEDRLLSLAGPHAREAIRALKLAGWETEPAFAQYFKLVGDPYRTLSDLYDASTDELRRLLGS